MKTLTIEQTKRLQQALSILNFLSAEIPDSNTRDFICEAISNLENIVFNEESDEETD